MNPIWLDCLALAGVCAVLIVLMAESSRHNP